MPLAIEHDYNFIDAMQEDARGATTPPAILTRRSQRARKDQLAVAKVIARIKTVSQAADQRIEAEQAYNKIHQVWMVADIEERRAIEPNLWAAMDRQDNARKYETRLRAQGGLWS